MAELRRDETLEIPADVDYGALPLSGEDAEKLAAARPATLAAARRLPGVTPAALLLLLQVRAVHVGAQRQVGVVLPSAVVMHKLHVVPASTAECFPSTLWLPRIT